VAFYNATVSTIDDNAITWTKVDLIVNIAEIQVKIYINGTATEKFDLTNFYDSTVEKVNKLKVYNLKPGT